MISPNQIWCIVEPVDMRLGIDGLSQWVQENLAKPPCDGTAWAFCNRSKTRLKLLIWDGTGVWCCQRRLHRGCFVWPKANEKSWVLTHAQWEWLMKGVDWQRLSAQANRHWGV